MKTLEMQALTDQFGRNLAYCRKRDQAVPGSALAVRASLHRTAVGQLERANGLPAWTRSLSSPVPSASRRKTARRIGLDPGSTLVGVFSFKVEDDE